MCLEENQSSENWREPITAHGLVKMVKKSEMTLEHLAHQLQEQVSMFSTEPHRATPGCSATIQDKGNGTDLRDRPP